MKLPGIGVEINGARRWIGAGPLQFQPSELMKLALVLYATRLLATTPSRLRTLKDGAIGPVLLVTGAAILLVATQPDLGTALVIAFTIGALLLVAGVPLRPARHDRGRRRRRSSCSSSSSSPTARRA